MFSKANKYVHQLVNTNIYIKTQGATINDNTLFQTKST
jgi:hypothetical protein